VVFRIVQRELGLVILLSAITIPLFVFTRSMAAHNRARSIEIANIWYQRGQHLLRAGNTQQAIDSFRNATTNDHDNSNYTLALSTALAAEGHIEEARQALLRLRASAPENGEINLNLARLAAKEGEMPEAVRYYHNALFGFWPADQMAAQRTKVRTELIRFLLAAGNKSQALSELLILSSDTPDNGPSRDNVGQLFLEAGDSQHALDQFTGSVRLNAKDPDALSGAGHASFNLGDYSKARRYFEAAIDNGFRSADVQRLLETAKFVLSRDPLAPRLGTEERVRRLTEDLKVVLDELQSCVINKQGDENSLLVLRPLIAELADGLETQFQPKALRGDAEGFRTGLNLIQRAESATSQICGDSSALHNALLLIGRKYGVTEQ